MKYIVEYTLPYLHHVQVGLEASSSDEATDEAEALFASAEIWSDTPACRLLIDDYVEDVAAGAALTFTVEREIDDGDEFPTPDTSVVRLQTEAHARSAAQAIITAYQQGEANGGSIEWADIDAAYELALKARF